MNKPPDRAKNLRIFLFTVLSVTLLDQITKAAVSLLLEPDSVVSVVPGLLNVVHYKNPGAAFGILGDSGRAGAVILSAISLLAVVVLSVLVLQSRDLWSAISLSLITGGAVGNLIDRVRTGAVVDFVDLHIGRYHWPAFNVADTAITAGVGMALFIFYIKGR